MSILTNIQFLKLWGNQVLIQIAFNMTNFSALLLIDQLTNSRFALATFYAAMTLPAFLVGLFAGSVVDLADRKRLMLTTDLLLAVLFAAYALLSGNYLSLLAVAFATASVSQFFIPAEAATIPLIVGPRDLQKANALFLFTELGSVLLGYAIAGPIMEAFGGLANRGAIAAFGLASILAAIGFFLRLSLSDIKHEKPEIIEGRIFRRTLTLTKEALVEFKRNPKISIPIVLLTAMEFNVGILAILFISYVRDYLHLPTTAASYYLIIPVIGGLVLGLYLMSKLKRPRSSVVLLGALSFALSVTFIGLSAKLLGTSSSIYYLRLLTILGAIGAGIAAVFIQVNAQTTLQESSRSSMLGRTFSLAAVASSAIAPIPILLISLITEKVDVTTIFIILGVLLLIGSLLLRPFLHNMDDYPVPTK
jgi:MFS family permease